MSEQKIIPWLFPKNTYDVSFIEKIYNVERIILTFYFEGVLYKNKCKLYGIFIDDSNKKEEIQKYLVSLMKTPLYCHFHKSDKYGRFLITMYRSREDAESQEFNRSINNELIIKNLAKQYERKNKNSN